MDKSLALKEYIKNNTDFGNYILNHWLEKEFLTPQWWFLLILVIIVLALWWKLVDKTRFETIFIYGLLWGIVATTHNTYLGLIFVCWIYPINLSPSATLLNPINYFVLPVIFMLIFQYFSTWKSFFIATVVFSVFAAFVLEPLFKYFHIYRPINWSYFYSFILYNVIAISLRWLTLKVKNVHKIS